MSSSLSEQLRKSARKLKGLTHTRDRNIAHAELDEVIDRVITALEKRTDAASLRFAVLRHLAAIGRGNLFPGMKNYIKNTTEFDSTTEGLRELVGEVEEIKIIK